ncbi:MAG: hypothetical protein NVS2B15_08620 [Pseudarthrobacter sp.]
MEAGGVACSEELLRIGAVAVAAQLQWTGQADVQLAVVGAGVAIAAFAGGQGLSSVEGFHVVRSVEVVNGNLWGAKCELGAQREL